MHPGHTSWVHHQGYIMGESSVLKNAKSNTDSFPCKYAPHFSLNVGRGRLPKVGPDAVLRLLLQGPNQLWQVLRTLEQAAGE
jgi:hypothetical protein